MRHRVSAYQYAEVTGIRPRFAKVKSQIAGTYRQIHASGQRRIWKLQIDSKGGEPN